MRLLIRADGATMTRVSVLLIFNLNADFDGRAEFGD